MQMKKHFSNIAFGIVEILITIFVILLIAVLTKTILKKIPSNVLLILLLICVSIPFVLWVKKLHLEPEADQKMIHQMAIAFCR